MKEQKSIKNIHAKKKILPSFGGVSQKYIKKINCLRNTLIFLSEQLPNINDPKKDYIDEKLKIKK